MSKIIVRGSKLIPGVPCVNVFVDSNDYGHYIATSYDLNMNCSLKEKRITDVNQGKIYEKNLTVEYFDKHKDSKNIRMAINLENRRVNALKAVIDELDVLTQIGVDTIITVYIPKPLLDAINNTNYKEFMYNVNDTEFFSEQELALWREGFCPIMQAIGDRIVFADIESCKIEKKKKYNNRYNNRYNNTKEEVIEVTQERLDRMNIYYTLHKIMVEEFKKEQALRENNQPQDFEEDYDDLEEDNSMPF